MKAPLSQTLFLTEDGSTIPVAVGNAVAIPPIVIGIPPTFDGTPSFQSDSTPQVGEPLLGIDAAVLNLGTAILRRAWLLGSTVLVEDASFTPDDDQTYTFRNQLVVAGVVVATVSVDVQVAAASPPPAPVHQLLPPAIEQMPGDDDFSVGLLVTLQYDELLPATGYEGFVLTVERATDDAFSAGYVNQSREITAGTPGSAIDSGALDFTVTNGLSEGVEYRFRVYVEPPTGNTSFTRSTPSDTIIKRVTISPTTFDPVTKHNKATLSVDNLTLTGVDDGTPQYAKSTTAKRGGSAKDKGYVEFLIVGANANEGVVALFDAATVTSGNSSPAPGKGSVPGIRYLTGGYIDHSGNDGAGAPALASGDVLGMYIDATAGRVWFKKNAAWIAATGDPIASTPGPGLPINITGDVFAGAGVNYSACAVTARFGATDQQYRGSLPAYGV